MAKEWAYVAGGLLSGAGEAMADKGRAAREARLAELEHGRAKELVGIRHENDMTRQGADHAFRAGESEADRAHRMKLEGVSHGNAMARLGADHAFRAEEGERERGARAGLLSNTERFTDADGRMWERGPEGVRPIAGTDGEQLAGAPDVANTATTGGMNDKELIASVAARHTREVVPEGGEDFAEPVKITDWNAVARSLEQIGRPDLARMYEGGDAAPGAQEGGAMPEQKQYNSPEDVQAAFREGLLSAAQAKSLLEQQFPDLVKELRGQ